MSTSQRIITITLTRVCSVRFCSRSRKACLIALTTRTFFIFIFFSSSCFFSLLYLHLETRKEKCVAGLCGSLFSDYCVRHFLSGPRYIKTFSIIRLHLICCVIKITALETKSFPCLQNTVPLLHDTSGGHALTLLKPVHNSGNSAYRLLQFIRTRNSSTQLYFIPGSKGMPT